MKIEEDKELRYIFDAVQELMRDIAIELPRMELSLQRIPRKGIDDTDQSLQYS